MKIAGNMYMVKEEACSVKEGSAALPSHNDDVARSRFRRGCYNTTRTDRKSSRNASRALSFRTYNNITLHQNNHYFHLKRVQLYLILPNLFPQLHIPSRVRGQTRRMKIWTKSSRRPRLLERLSK